MYIVIFSEGECMSNKILKGTMLLTGAAFLSKFLGMIYVIPFNALVGDQGGALYYYAYNPYTILISLSTVGIPLAVSKIVSRYNSLGYYDVGFKVFRSGLYLMFLTGFIAFVCLFFSAEWLATKFTYEDTAGNTVEDVKAVIRMVSFALLLIPGMSIVRGFFQGNQTMEPTAISQVVEQIARISFVLLSVFIILKVYDGTIVLAVSFATFAAFIGAFASCIVLLLFWLKRRHGMRAKLETQTKQLEISTGALMKELMSYAGPFVMVGIAIPLVQMVDSFTFNKAMGVSGLGDIAEQSLATINFYAHKLVIIPVTLATGLSLSIVPALTDSFTKQNRKKLFHEINQALQIVLLLVIPAVVGLSVLANEAYGSIFGMSDLGLKGPLLAWYAPVALGFALFTVTAAILQGINEQRFAIVSLLAAMVVKVLFNSFFIHLLGAKGSIIVTGLAFGMAVLLNLWKVKHALDFSFQQTGKRTLFMAVFSGIMALSIWIIKLVLGVFIPYDTQHLYAIIVLMIGVMAGGAVYFILALKSTLLTAILGEMKVLNRFRRKKDASR